MPTKDELLPKIKRRMDAYYYCFCETGIDCIDKILSAIACAGKSYHDTDMWLEESWENNDAWDTEGHSGKSCIEMIQNAANEAAKELNTRHIPQLPTFAQVLFALDHYTAKPKDNDYDRHVYQAMRSVYDMCKKAIEGEVINEKI